MTNQDLFPHTLRILVLSPGFPDPEDLSGNFYGGSFVFTEAEAYHKAGAKVTVLTPHIPGLKHRQNLSERFEIIRFPYFLPERFQKLRLQKTPLYSKRFFLLRLFQLPFFLFSFFLHIFRLGRKVDIIHANWTPTALLALPIKFFTGLPVVLTYRGSDIRLLPKALNNFIFRNVSAVLDIWGNTKLGEKIRADFPANYVRLPIISKIPNQIELSAQNENKKEIITFTFMGRLVSSPKIWKGADIIIPAIRILVQRHKKFKLQVLGDGPIKNHLERQCKDWGLYEHVKFFGYQKDVFPFLLASDAVIGGVAINAVAQEAALCGCLLIIPNIPFLNGKIWIDKKNAVLYKPHDPQSLASAMQYVIEHPVMVTKIAAEGQITMRRYVVDRETGGKIYCEAFRKIISQTK